MLHGTPDVTHCGDVVASCVCTKPLGHVDDGDEVHKCANTGECMGEWIGSEADPESFDVVTWPGGYKTMQEAKAAMLRRILLGPVF